MDRLLFDFQLTKRLSFYGGFATHVGVLLDWYTWKLKGRKRYLAGELKLVFVYVGLEWRGEGSAA